MGTQNIKGRSIVAEVASMPSGSFYAFSVEQNSVSVVGHGAEFLLQQKSK